MRVKEIVHFDDLGDVYVFWLDLAEPEESLVNIAKEIDKENYSEDCFGMCVQQDIETNEFVIVTDGLGDTQLYYVDNNGNKHWLEYQISEEIKEAAINLCIKELMGDN